MYTIKLPLTALICALTLMACTMLIAVDREDDVSRTSQSGGEANEESGGEVDDGARDSMPPDEDIDIGVGGTVYYNDWDAMSPDEGVDSDAGQAGGSFALTHDMSLPPPPPRNLTCAACVVRDAVMRGLSRLPIPLYCGHIEAGDGYVPIVWTSAEGVTGAERMTASGRAVPGWLGRYAPAGEPVVGGRVAAWGHEGILTVDLDPIPEAGLARERLIAWLAGSGSRRVGVMEGHGEWLHMGSISSQLINNLSRVGIELSALPAPITPESLTDLDAVIFGNPWLPVTTAELDALTEWLSRDRGLFLLGLGWSWEPSNPDDPTGETYAVNTLAARLNLAFYEGVITDPDTLAPPPEQPTYRVRPLIEWPGALPSE